MNSKTLIIGIATLTLTIMGVYFLISPSYEKSLKAKYYYETGDYKEALVLARESFSLNLYNRMAATIMAQSITSLKYANYIDEAQKYMKSINEIATHEFISGADKAKIRTMCNIMIGSYVKLAPSVVTDSDLVQEAATHYNNFEKILEKVNR